MKQSIIFLLCLFSLLCAIKGAVMGVDFGSEFYKISMIAPGKSFVVMENTFSNRKTHTAISFTTEERVYESAAVSRKIKYPESTFWFVQKFLLAMEEDRKLIEVSQELFEDYLIEIDPNRKTLNFKIPHFHLENEFTHNENGDFLLSVEEVLAMILIHAKQLAEKQITSQIRDCVFTIPSNWDLPKRQALYASAQLANLTILSFIKENTAAALAYGFERQDINASHLALFYNFGSSSAKVSLVEYFAANVSGKIIENVKVLADETDEEVSAQLFDMVLAKHVAKLFDESPERKGKPSILQFRPNFRRLMRESSKFKEVLSANKKAFLHVESLLSDVDFKVLVERSAFEFEARFLIEKLHVSIEKVLKKAQKTIEDIDAIEMIGGGVRIPMVQNLLSDYFKGKELGAHLNGDEAMTLGAVFQAANYSSIYKVRPIWLYDGLGYPIRLVVKELQTGEILKEMDLFEDTDFYGKKLQVSFDEVKNLQLVLERKINEGQFQEFRVYDFSNIETVFHELEPLNISNVHVQFNLTLCSIRGVDVIGYIQYQTSKIQEVEEIVIEDDKVEEVLKNEENSSENEQNSSENEQNSSENEENLSEGNSFEADTNDTENTINLKAKTIKQLKEIFKNHEKRINSTVWTLGPRTLNEDEMKLSRRKIQFLNEDEDLRKKTVQTKNSLEELIYKINDYNSDELYLLVSNETQREEINLLAEENRAWFDTDEAFSSNLSVYTYRYQQLHNLTNYITWRMEEYKLRPQAINDTRRYLKQWEDILLKMNTTHPWITHKDRYTTMALVLKAQKWIETAVEAQNNLSLFENPILRVYEISSMLEVVGGNVTALKNLRPPKNYYEDMIKKMNLNLTKDEKGNKQKGEENNEEGNILFGEEDIDLDSQENIVKEETSTNVDSEEKKEDDENIQLPNNEEIEGQNQEHFDSKTDL